MTERDIHDRYGVLLARILSGTWAEGIHFFTEDHRFIQVATMNYDDGHHMRSHKHNIYSRMAHRTNEVMYVCSGKVRAIIFSESGKVVDRVELKEGDIIIFHAGGHGFDILADGTRILEVKNGPYFGVERDKTFLESDDT